MIFINSTAYRIGLYIKRGITVASGLNQPEIIANTREPIIRSILNMYDFIIAACTDAPFSLAPELPAGVFLDAASEKIFEDKNKGMLA